MSSSNCKDSLPFYTPSSPQPPPPYSPYCTTHEMSSPESSSPVSPHRTSPQNRSASFTKTLASLTKTFKELALIIMAKEWLLSVLATILPVTIVWLIVRTLVDGEQISGIGAMIQVFLSIIPTIVHGFRCLRAPFVWLILGLVLFMQGVSYAFVLWST